MVNIAILGASGIIGQNIGKLLGERNFPFKNLYLLTTDASKGKQQRIAEKDYLCESMDNFDFSSIDIVFGALDIEPSKKIQKKFPQSLVYIDNSSAFRMDPSVPLVVPEINAQVMQKPTIVANPNCTTIIMCMALYPLFQKWGLQRLITSSYQSISGQGSKGIDNLFKESSQFVSGQGGGFSVTHDSIAFNAIPFIGNPKESLDSITTEENKMIEETRKILNLDSDVSIISTCVRLPVFIGHGISVTATFNKKINTEEVLALWEEASGVIYTRSLANLTPRGVQGEDAVFVGRLRQFDDYTLSFWVVGDNILKGGALNAVQIAETIIKP